MSRILFDPETIQLLAAIVREQGLTELEMQEGDCCLKLVRAVPVAAAVAAPAPVVVNTAPAASGTIGAAGGAVSREVAVEAPPPVGAVKSPMVGIVYLAPEPGAAAYITLGQAVSAGQTLLLIEAMKTFNQIKSPRAGVVTQILVEAGAPVEYDQPLLVVS